MAEMTEIWLVERFRERIENETRSGAMDLTLSKSFTLGIAQVNMALLSFNRDLGCTCLFIFLEHGAEA